VRDESGVTDPEPLGDISAEGEPELLDVKVPEALSEGLAVTLEDAVTLRNALGENVPLEEPQAVSVGENVALEDIVAQAVGGADELTDTEESTVIDGGSAEKEIDDVENMVTVAARAEDVTEEEASAEAVLGNAVMEMYG
jgi:hypothetical protein